MLTKELFFVLLVGTVIMCIPISFQMKWYSVSCWKSIFVSVALVFTGVTGSYIWYFVENLSWGGRSFFGAVFFAPVVFLPVAKLLRISYGDSLDFCAPAGCMTLAMVKIQCLRDSCCEGMILYIDENRRYVRFPSQIAEMIAFLLIAAVLMILSHDMKNRKTIFPWFLILYGAARFVLNFFRDNNGSFALGLSAGSFWSMCAFIIGLSILLIIKKKKKGGAYARNNKI